MQIVKAQALDTIFINKEDKEYFKKKKLVKPNIEGINIETYVEHYFKKSSPSAYYIIDFRLRDVVIKSCEGLVINGKFEGVWITKNFHDRIESTNEFISNKFEGKQVNFDGDKIHYEISCKKNTIIEYKTYDSKGELYMIKTYSKGKLISKEIFGRNAEFYIQKKR